MADMYLKWFFVLTLLIVGGSSTPLSNPASLTGTSEHVSYKEEVGRNPLRRGSHYPLTNSHGPPSFLREPPANTKHPTSGARQFDVRGRAGTGSAFPLGNRFPVAQQDTPPHPSRGDAHGEKGEKVGGHFSAPSGTKEEKDNDPLSLGERDKTDEITREQALLGSFANLFPPSKKGVLDNIGGKRSGPNPDPNSSPFNLISPTAFASQDPRLQSSFSQENKFSNKRQQNTHPHAQSQQGFASSSAQLPKPTIYPSTYVLHNFPNKANPQFGIIEDTSDNFVQSQRNPSQISAGSQFAHPSTNPVNPTVTQSLFVQAPTQLIPSRPQSPGGEGPIIISHGQGSQQRPVLMQLDGRPGPGRPLSSLGSFSTHSDGSNTNFGGTVQHHPIVNVGFETNRVPAPNSQANNFGFPPSIIRPDSQTNLGPSGSRSPTLQSSATRPQPSHFPSFGANIGHPAGSQRPNINQIRPSKVDNKSTYTRLVVLPTPQPKDRPGGQSNIPSHFKPFSQTSLQNQVQITKTPSSFSRKPQTPTSFLQQNPQFSQARPGGHHRPSFSQQEEVSPPREYSYGYAVDDRTTGDQKSAYETSGPDGVVQGRYTIVQPDGLFRVVTYTADKENGFRANVDYLPTVSVKGKSVKEGKERRKSKT